MLKRLLRSAKGTCRRPRASSCSSPLLPRLPSHTTEGYFGQGHRERGANDDDGGNEDDDEDEDGEDEPVLPIFSAEHLDRLPIYHLIRDIHKLVAERCQTTLSWDQLRSPQVSQFLVKPIQLDIHAFGLFSRGTLFALVASCLHFRKDGQPISGVMRTRGMVCELLAMRMLKEFSTRELIDALSYDFDPLQGLQQPAADPGRHKQSTSPRMSAIEVAIRAEAKRFLAHPLVVKQLEAIWSGAIVFHSYADSLHRPPAKRRLAAGPSYGAMLEHSSRPPAKQNTHRPLPPQLIRRTVTLYDPREASLFKLSRLRVPRYRQIFSTCSYAVMLGLFLAVLVNRSADITALEVVFWFWSAGYLLEEIVTYTEQGFNLYILSVWKLFDLGILMIVLVYYVFRLYVILAPNVSNTAAADWPYDILAITSVLLFPRLFSVLDHYRYFSQLLIAFRMMAMDLVAVLVLIVISCSGFFVVFTLGFGDLGFTSAGSAAYALFQMLMGFTPTAWNMWDSYNPLGKAILTLFLFISHFLIVTILITVLTNSFMAVVQNANEEHQFLFAVNTFSMVKSDALFSYIAPSNIIAWLLTPLRYTMPFRSFVKMNRTLIKITHFPILFAIFSYERFILSRVAFQPEDLVECRGRARAKVPVAFSNHGAHQDFTPREFLREPSVVSIRKRNVLDEVFRRPLNKPAPVLRREIPATMEERRKSSAAVRDWMNGMGHEGGASPPEEEPRSVLDRLEQSRRPGTRRARTSRMVHARRVQPPTSRSVVSDPDFTPTNARFSRNFGRMSLMSQDGQPQQTDADGDDELVTNDDNDDDRLTLGQSIPDRTFEPIYEHPGGESQFVTPVATQHRKPVVAPASVVSPIQDESFFQRPPTAGQDRPHHERTLSTSTVILASTRHDGSESRHDSDSSSPPQRPATARRSGTTTPQKRPVSKRSMVPPQPPPPLPTQGGRAQANLIGFGKLPRPARAHQNPSFAAVALDLASDLGDNRSRPDIPGPPSLFTQLEYRGGRPRQFPGRGGVGDGTMDDKSEDEDRSHMNRILLARMNTFEERLKDLFKEMHNLNKAQPRQQQQHAPPAADKKSRSNRNGTKTPATAGTRTPGGTSSAGTASTAIHDGVYDVDVHQLAMQGQHDDDGDSVRRIKHEEEGHDQDVRHVS